MGQFKHLSGMVVMHHVEGPNADGKLVRVEHVERPMGASLGVVWVRVFIDGQGISAEQFSGVRVALADRAFKVAARQIAGQGPAPKPARVAGAAGPETVLLDEAGVTVVMITGKGARFEIRRSGAEPEVIPATARWQAEKKQAVERGRSYITA
jgi:hypothetical protein